jgi:hypothetical protein
LCLVTLCCCAGCSTDTSKQQQHDNTRSSSSSSLLHDPRVRVLLVGCCSQGSVAVWDVQLQQQIMALHSPDLSLAALLPVQPPVCHMLAAAAAATSAAESSKGGSSANARKQLQQPLLLLALVASRDSTATPPAATAKTVSRIGSKARGAQLSLAAAAAATESQQQQQQQHLELRPVLLQQPGLLVPGAPILAPAAAGVGCDLRNHAQVQQPLASPGFSAAALSGTLAAAVGPGGFVHVWDVLSGKSLLGAEQSAVGSAFSSSSRAGVLAAVELVELSTNQQRGGGGAAAAGCIVLMGSADGVLTCALV